MITIDDLLLSLQYPSSKKKTKGMGLDVSKATWSRIGQKDSFSELGLGGAELSSFLSEWISENPYNNI